MMIIKTFTEESSAAALKRVRQEMGGEAIVLKTRRVVGDNNKPMFEVTACLDKPPVARTPDILSDNGLRTNKTEITTPWKRVDTARSTSGPVKDETPADELDDRIAAIDRKLNQLISMGIQPDGITRLEMFQSVHRTLKAADLPDDYLESFIPSLVEDYDGSTDVSAYTEKRMAGELETMIAEPLEFEPGDRLVFIGPAGSGKSSAMGKLAAALTARKKKKVKLLSLDDYKMAAFDEICSYAEILGIEVVPPPAAGDNADKDSDAVTLIDAPALPTKREKVEILKRKIDEVNPRYRFAVFSCLTRSRDVFQICRLLKELEPTHLILTMEDLASCLGTVVTAARAGGLKIAYISDSPGGMGELKRPDAGILASKLLSDEVPRD